MCRKLIRQRWGLNVLYIPWNFNHLLLIFLPTITLVITNPNTKDFGYNENLAVYNSEEGFVVRKLFKIKKEQYKTCTYSGCVFICFLRVLAMYPTVWIPLHSDPPIVRYDGGLLHLLTDTPDTHNDTRAGHRAGTAKAVGRTSPP
jgi:hypothetical protein